MKFIKLLTAARVGGVLRHPHEGVLHLSDDDAQRLLDDKAGDDVSSDFSAEQRKDVPVEEVANAADLPLKAPAPEPHQSDIAPSQAPIEEAPKPARGKSAPDKE